MLLYIIGGNLFGVSPNLADHDDGFRLRIFVEKLERIQEVRADNGVATNPDGRGLSDAALRELEDRFVGQGAGARDDADIAFLVNMAGHDADLAPPRRYDAGTIRANQPRLSFQLQILVGAHHVEHWDAFGDADDQRYLGVNSFHDRIGGKRRRNEDHRGVGAGFLTGFQNAVEYRPAFVRGAALAGCNAADNLRAISGTALGVECALASGDALDDEPGGFINKYRHNYLPLAAATTRSAASFMFSATVKFSPEFLRISRPCSTLVPSSRSTIGN